VKALALSRTSKEYIAYMATLNLGFFVFQSYYILYLRVNGLSYTDITFIFAANFVALALLNFVSGNFADRHGRKKAIVIGGAINVVGFLIYGLSSSLLLFLAAEIILAGSWSLIGGSVEAWFVDELKAGRRPGEAARTFPLSGGIGNILGIVGGVIGSLLAAVALNLPMLAGALFVGAATLLALLFFNENFGDRTERFSAMVRQSMGHFRRSAALRDLTYGEMLRSAAVVVYLLIYQPYMVAVGLGEQYLGLYFSMLMISTALGNLLSGRLADRSGRHILLASSCTVMLASFLIQPLVQGFLLAGFLFALTGFANGLALPTVMVWRNSLIPSGMRASTLALLSSMLNLAAATLSLGLGPLIDATSLQAAMLVGAMLSLLAIPFYFLAQRRSQGAGDELQAAPAIL